MLLKFFRRFRISTLLVMLGVITLFWAGTLMQKYPPSTFTFDSFGMPLYVLIVKILSPYSFLSKLVAFALTLTVAIYLLQFNVRHTVVRQRTYLPFLFFVLVASSLTQLQRLNPAIIANIFILVSLSHVISTYQNSEALDHLFRSGLLLGIGTLLYAPTVVFVFLIFWSIATLRQFNLREWLVTLVGILVPWGAVVFYFFWFDLGASEPFIQLANSLCLEAESSADKIAPIILCVAVGVPLLVAILHMLTGMGSQKIAIRKHQNIMLLFTVVALLSFFVVPSCSYEILYIAAAPISLLLSEYFSDAKGKYWPEILFLIFILGLVSMQLYPLLMHSL